MIKYWQKAGEVISNVDVNKIILSFCSGNEINNWDAAKIISYIGLGELLPPDSANTPEASRIGYHVLDVDHTTYFSQ
ncbi:MAG: hypothetical protein HRU35_03615 [Rickettsiaceae bacterium]|nr:hypothetical protein [Rickettsiaceae bacterium]